MLKDTMRAFPPETDEAFAPTAPLPPEAFRQGKLLVTADVSLDPDDISGTAYTCERPVRIKGGAIVTSYSGDAAVSEKNARHAAELGAYLVDSLGL